VAAVVVGVEALVGDQVLEALPAAFALGVGE
jgi:hypothetical protein